MDELTPSGTPPRRLILARISAFPSERWSGMSYRQWLIGVCLSGILADSEIETAEHAVDLAFTAADKAIARIASEMREDAT